MSKRYELKDIGKLRTEIKHSFERVRIEALSKQMPEYFRLVDELDDDNLNVRNLYNSARIKIDEQRLENKSLKGQLELAVEALEEIFLTCKFSEDGTEHDAMCKMGKIAYDASEKLNTPLISNPTNKEEQDGS